MGCGIRRRVVRALYALVWLVATACGSRPPAPGPGETLVTEHGTYELRDGRVVIFGTLHDGPYAVIDGQVVVEGDILAGDAEQLEALGRGTERRAVEGLAGFPTSLWTDRRIPYVIDSSAPDSAEIRRVVSEWNDAISAVTLVPRDAERDYVRFRGSSDGGCNSEMGRIGGEQVINVASWCVGGNLLHEIAHAAGVWHEQTRSDRDAHIVVDWANIQPRWHYAFRTYGEQGYPGQDIGDFDFESVMLYGSYSSFAIDVSRPVLTRVSDGSTWQQNRSHLSAGDIAGITVLYARLPPAPPPDAGISTDGGVAFGDASVSGAMCRDDVFGASIRSGSHGYWASDCAAGDARRCSCDDGAWMACSECGPVDGDGTRMVGGGGGGGCSVSTGPSGSTAASWLVLLLACLRVRGRVGASGARRNLSRAE